MLFHANHNISDCITNNWRIAKKNANVKATRMGEVATWFHFNQHWLTPDSMDVHMSKSIGLTPRIRLRWVPMHGIMNAGRPLQPERQPCRLISVCASVASRRWLCGTFASRTDQSQPITMKKRVNDDKKGKCVRHEHGYTERARHFTS